MTWVEGVLLVFVLWTFMVLLCAALLWAAIWVHTSPHKHPDPPVPPSYSKYKDQNRP